MTKIAKAKINARRKEQSAERKVKRVQHQLSHAQMEAQIASLEARIAMLEGETQTTDDGRLQTADGSKKNSADGRLPSAVSSPEAHRVAGRAGGFAARSTGPDGKPGGPKHCPHWKNSRWKIPRFLSLSNPFLNAWKFLPSTAFG